jgi:hypothetical protein
VGYSRRRSANRGPCNLVDDSMETDRSLATMEGDWDAVRPGQWSDSALEKEE